MVKHTLKMQGIYDHKHPGNFRISNLHLYSNVHTLHTLEYKCKLEGQVFMHVHIRETILKHSDKFSECLD